MRRGRCPWTDGLRRTSSTSTVRASRSRSRAKVGDHEPCCPEWPTAPGDAGLSDHHSAQDPWPTPTVSIFESIRTDDPPQPQLSSAQNEYAEKAASTSPVPERATRLSYAEAAAICRTKFRKIADECGANIRKYRDPHFDLEADLKLNQGDPPRVALQPRGGGDDDASCGPSIVEEAQGRRLPRHGQAGHRSRRQGASRGRDRLERRTRSTGKSCCGSGWRAASRTARGGPWGERRMRR
ncbi:hypothetical protein VUR80DRAFT_4332 [Thermomyces stellatus]